MFKVTHQWNKLKTCVVGSAYPPELFSFIQDAKLRKYFEKLAIETEEDIGKLVTLLKKFDVEVIRPAMPSDLENFRIKNGYIAPPISARDFMTMIDEKLYYPGLPNINHAWVEFCDKHKIDNKSNTNIKYDYSSITQKENSISETFIFSSGSDYIKNEVSCDLEGQYSSAFINGIHLLSKNKHHEIRTNTNHLYENTKSYQLIKSVIDDSSKSVYQGKIYVDSKAQKTDGYQLSKAVLLNEKAEFNAKPELEIYADDVKCSHGSASGSLNEESIFYLMSRGLDNKTAKELLITGFFLDVVEKITDEEIKKLIKNLIGLNQ